VFFLRDDNVKLSRKQKNQLAALDAVIGGVFLQAESEIAAINMVYGPAPTSNSPFSVTTTNRIGFFSTSRPLTLMDAGSPLSVSVNVFSDATTLRASRSNDIALYGFVGVSLSPMRELSHRRRECRHSSPSPCRDTRPVQHLAESSHRTKAAARDLRERRA